MKPAGGRGPLLAAVALAAAVPFVQRGVDARLGTHRAQEDVRLIWSGRQLKRAAPGFEGLLADVYWLRTVQYFGAQHAFSRTRDYGLLVSLIDATVTLDPRLEIAYQYGAIFLGQPPPLGAGRAREAVDLLERGVRANPQNWRLRKELGYSYFLLLGDSKSAARVLDEAADLPGAAYWLRTMAADILARGGDLQNSRAVWMQIYKDSEGVIRENARTHLRLLDALETRDRLRQFVDAFKAATGRYPARLDELGARGLVRSVPGDPSGKAFVYDPSTGQVGIDPTSPLWRPDQ